MIAGDSKKLEAIAQGNVCAEHQLPLTVAWHAEKSTYVLRCGHGEYPSAIAKKITPREEYARSPVIQPAPFRQLPVTYDLGTNQALDDQSIATILDFADRYHLDAYRGHVVLMHGRPYVGLDGYAFVASRSGQPYRLETRPLTEDERAAMRLGTEDHGWKCELTKIITGEFFVGLGIVTRAELEEKSSKNPSQPRAPVVARYPWQMSQKRAEWQAYRRAFPIGEVPGDDADASAP
jgi:hypothetical protein